MQPAPDTSIALTGVRHAYGALDVLAGVELRIAAGARVALVGPSGCGKSTLLSLVAGLEQPLAGVVAVGGRDQPSERLARCALMPQRDLLLPWRSALDNACVALENRGVRRREAREAARPLFERFGLASFEHARPGDLSGGMRQRVAFLRTLLAGKDVLLLDEPFGSLDAITRARMQEWLAVALANEPRTVVLVTHDVEEALLLCRRVVVLSERPARVVRELEADVPPARSRRELVSSTGFGALRERALEALE